MNALSEVKPNELMCISPEAFKDGMANLAGAVNIVTTVGKSGKVGFTATAVCSVSDNPATMLVCLNRNASVYQTFKDCNTLAINTLGVGQDSLSNLFGGKASMGDRFASGEWETLTTGSPILSNAAVSFDCIVTAKHSVATHDVMYCEVVAISQNTLAGSLIYHQRGYQQLSAKAD
jgi:flavin reductase